MAAHPLYALVQPVLAPLPVIWANQNGPRPAKPYATLRIAGVDPAPSIVESAPDAAGLAVIREHRRIRAETEVWGPGAIMTLQDAAMRLRAESNILRADILNLGIGRVRAIRDLTALMNDNTQFEERALLEFEVYAAAEGTDAVGVIEHVVLTPGAAAPGAFSGCDETVTSPLATTPAP